ncbi:MAG TPA: PilN domain-containing protein [Methylomirabilota bacterium]|nr:PilN domain-containing protein [Methylomirabilota bacterium]
MIRINLGQDGDRRGGPSFSLGLPSFNVGMLFLAVYVLGVGGLGFYWLTLHREEARLTAELDRARSENERLKVANGQAGNIKERVVEMQKRVASVHDLVKSQGRPIQLLDAFVDTIPQDLWITALEEKNAVVKIVGTAYSSTAVSDLMSNLKRSGKFKDIDIAIARQDLVKSPRPVTFEVTCRFEG